MGTKTKQNKLKRIITFPVRALVKARDSYVRGMTSFSERGAYGGFSESAAPSSRSSNLKSCSISSSRSSVYESDDMAELIRAASVKRLGGRLTDQLDRRPVVPPAAPATGVVPRSCSVGMGKIDENSICEFGEEEEEDLGVMYPRSRSAYVVAKRSTMI